MNPPHSVLLSFFGASWEIFAEAAPYLIFGFDCRSSRSDGIPLYICATVSIPLAASLVAKGMSPGTAFVFLLADPTTNAATITMVAHFLEKRSAALIWERFLSVS